VGSLDDSLEDSLCFVSEELARYPSEAMFRFDLPRLGDTWALRIFPQLVCMESVLQCAQRFWSCRAGSVEVDRLRFTGSPRPGDSLLVKLRRVESGGSSATLSVEVWVHHRMVAQGQLSAAQREN
jgi:hypothetical protein